MVRVKHTPTYKGSNPKLQKIQAIFKYSKALEKLLYVFQSEEILNSYMKDDNDNVNDNNKTQNNPSIKTKRRGRPKKEDKEIKQIEVKNEDKEIKQTEKENKFDDKVNIDYTGISGLFTSNKDCDIELK